MIAVSGSASGIGAAIRARLVNDGKRVIGIDLRDAGESRRDEAAPLEAGNFFQRFVRAVPSDLNLARTERAGPDEAHVSPENTDQLRQLVHCGRTQPPAYARCSRIAISRLPCTDSSFGVGDH